MIEMKDIANHSIDVETISAARVVDYENTYAIWVETAYGRTLVLSYPSRDAATEAYFNLLTAVSNVRKMTKTHF